MFLSFMNLLLIVSNKKVIPLCENCAFFSSEKSLCKKFGEIDSITKKYIYERADLCREDLFKCGKGGYYFKDTKAKN
jgi:hypothetical protein